MNKKDDAETEGLFLAVMWREGRLHYGVLSTMTIGSDALITFSKSFKIAVMQQWSVAGRRRSATAL